MIQAIIFDLDNTLFNTTGQLYVQARRKACKAMVKEGIPTTEEYLYQAMLDMYDDIGPFYTIVIEKLLDRFHIFEEFRRKKLREVAEEAYNSVNVSGITLFPGVKDMLVRLHEKHKLILLTSGWPEQQNKKVDALGIRSLFDMIIFDNIEKNILGAKEAHLKQVLKVFDLAAEEVLCVGDRIDKEIAAGNKIGMVTVQVLQGDYSALKPKNEEEEAQFIIDETLDVEEVLASLEEDEL